MRKNFEISFLSILLGLFCLSCGGGQADQKERTKLFPFQVKVFIDYEAFLNGGSVAIDRIKQVNYQVFYSAIVIDRLPTQIGSHDMEGASVSTVYSYIGNLENGNDTEVLVTNGDNWILVGAIPAIDKETGVKSFAVAGIGYEKNQIFNSGVCKDSSCKSREKGEGVPHVFVDQDGVASFEFVSVYLNQYVR